MLTAQFIKFLLVEGSFVPHLVNSLLCPLSEEKREGQPQRVKVLLGGDVGGSVQQFQLCHFRVTNGRRARHHRGAVRPRPRPPSLPAHRAYLFPLCILIAVINVSSTKKIYITDSLVSKFLYLSFCRHCRYNYLIHSSLRSDDKRCRVDTLYIFAHNQRAREKNFAAQEKFIVAQEDFFAAQE